jgi:putative ABC transport system permease protein
VAQDASRLPGIAAAASARQTQVIAVPPPHSSTQDLYVAEAVDERTISSVLHLDVRSGSLRDLRGDAIAVSFLQSLTMSWHVGDHVQIWLADGTPVTVRVAAIYSEDLALRAAQYFILPLQLVVAHTSEQTDSMVYLATTAGADQAQVAQELHALGAAYPTVQVVDRATFLRAASAQTLQSNIALLLFLGLAVVYTAISVVNTFVMSTAERGREFALLRVIGASASQIVRMIGWETTMTIALGIGLGVLITAVVLMSMSLAMIARVEIVVDTRVLVAILAGCTLLGLVAGVAPARLALRINPIEAMGIRE